MNKKVAVQIAPMNVQMRVGILKTIARSIYSDPKVKIREAVANSMDNGATWFVMFADKPSRTVSLMDNGAGITDGRFNEIFKYIGYGMQKKDRYSNSYFGLGLMSILELGKRATIITRSKGEEEVIKLDVDSEKIFSKEMEDKPISEIGNLLAKRPLDLSVRESVSILGEESIRKVFGDFPTHFTEIILSDIDERVFEEIISAEFEIELRKILPLRVQKNEPFFQSIKDPTALKWILEKLSNRDYCPTIDVYLGISEETKELGQIWKYYPDFRRDLEIGKADIFYGAKEKFAFYYLYSTDDLEERAKGNKETGLWVRNKNFLVKEADYFERPGSRGTIIHQPLRNWLFGEIFHQGMTDFLVVTRNEYNWDSAEFSQFYEEVYGLLYDLNRRLRKAWQYSKEVTESIVNPFLEMNEDRNPFSRCHDTLLEMGLLDSEEKAKEIFEKLKERRSPELENDNKRIDILIEKGEKEIALADDENVKVVIDPKVGPLQEYIKQREIKTDRVVVRISPTVFYPKEVLFLGKQFTVYYVAGEEELPGISIDSEKHKIFVNPFNQEVMKYSVSFVEVCLATEIAYIYSRTKDEMRGFILKLLGAKLVKEYQNPRKYLFSLKDELQRRQRSK